MFLHSKKLAVFVKLCSLALTIFPYKHSLLVTLVISKMLTKVITIELFQVGIDFLPYII